MNAQVPEAMLDRFGEFVAVHLGLNFPENRRRDLERGLNAAAREFGFDDAEACIRWLTESDPNRLQVEVLAHHLTTGETYFFRDQHIFQALEQQLLPELIAARQIAGRRLRLWSAGCASGEEPYSLSILLTRLLSDWQEWNVTILGTDINEQALSKATEGVYREWSFRDAPEWIKRCYFQQEREGRYEILPAIKHTVTYAFHNLAEDSYPSVANNTNAMDVILCCNVLMYFTPDARARVVERFYRSLVDGGWLIVSGTEAIEALFPQFEPVSVAGSVLFRRPRAVKGDVEWINQAQSAQMPEPSPPTESAPLAVAPAERHVPATANQPASAHDEDYQAALALYGAGRYREAIQMLQPMAEPRAYALTARAYANLGSLEEALGWSEQAVEAEKIDPGHRYLQASILIELGRRAAAIAALRRALYLDPGFVVAHVALANLLQQSGQRKEAGRHFRNALSLLQSYERDAVVPEAEGLTAGRLAESISVMWRDREA